MIHPHPAVAAAVVIGFALLVLWRVRLDYTSRGSPTLSSTVLQVFGMWILVWLCTVPFSSAAAIHDAARTGDLEAVRSILAADPHQLDAHDAIDHTPLSLAAAYGRWDLFRHLLDAGADVNAIRSTNATPMHSVCQHDRPDMVELLLEKGAEPSLAVRDVFGEYTPMLRAVQRGSRNVVALLLERGASPDEATREGWNALHLAAKCGHRHLYGLLIERGVSLDAEDQDGRTPMTYDHRRPDPVAADRELYGSYAGRYTWQGAADGPGVDIFLDDGDLVLDDYGLNTLYPIGPDTFHCNHDPWQVQFLRNGEGTVARVQLTFLRQSVILDKMP